MQVATNLVQHLQLIVFPKSEIICHNTVLPSNGESVPVLSKMWLLEFQAIELL